LLSIAFLLFGVFVADKTYVLGLIFWTAVLAGTGYRLFFNRSPRKD